MAKCEQCGNEYNKPMIVKLNGKEYTFDCFECAITALAPTCPSCGCRVIGHGVSRNDNIFCCDHCAKAAHQSAGA